jgi:putative oxidoreductase
MIFKQCIAIVYLPSCSKEMNIFNSTFFLRLAAAIILLIHGMGGMFNNGINDFGNYFLNPLGFAPFGVAVAWAIKLSHVVCALCLLLDKYVKWPTIITILILVAGIVLIHFKEGWFVVGGGRNGVEFNFLLIFVLLTIIFPQGLLKKN